MQRETLLLVLDDVRALVALPDNDFSFSGWRDREAALRELDAFARRVEAGALPSGLEVLFLPTGRLQEVSLASGWGEEFLSLAERFERACERDGVCRCLAPPLAFEDFERRHLGVDASGGRFADVELVRCRACGQRFVHYSYELEGFSRSGRWYRAPVTGVDARALGQENARALLAKARLYFCGGSYFDGSGRRGVGVLAPNRL
jgi:hypothetical protein